MKEMLSLYLQGDWSRLVEQLKEEIKRDALIGDSVQLTVKLCFLGCCHILSGNKADAYFIYQFINRTNAIHLSVKERANVLRFLALYALFDGNLQEAESYYDQAIEAFSFINEEQEKVMILIEAARWYYSLIGNREKMIYIRNKLKTLITLIFPLDKIESPESFWDYINFYAKTDKYSHPLIKQFQSFKNSIQSEDKKRITYEGNLLLATCRQYKHPIFHQWAKRLVAQHNTSRELQPAFHQPESHTTKLSFTLFNEFTIKGDNQRPQRIHHWKRKKAEELLILILVQPQLQAEKDWVVEELYPEEDYKKAMNRLYVNMNAINKTLKDILQLNDPLIFIKNNKVTLNISIIDEIDVQIYMKLISVGTHLWYENRDEAIEIFNKARLIYSQQFVEHLPYIPWLEQFRLTLRNKHLAMLQKLYHHTENLLTKENLLHEMLNCDPLNESTIKETFNFLQNQGRSFEAEQFFAQKRMQYSQELGIELKWM